MADQQWYLIPTAKVETTLTDPVFFLVRASEVTLVDSRPSTLYIDDGTASSAPRAPYSDQTALLPPPSDPGSAEAAAAAASTRGFLHAGITSQLPPGPSGGGLQQEEAQLEEAYEGHGMAPPARAHTSCNTALGNAKLHCVRGLVSRVEPSL